MRAMAISRSGLDVEWQRLQIIADNLASAGTSRTADGRPARAHRLVSIADGFGRALGSAGRPGGVRVQGVEPLANGTRRVYDPTDPDAGTDGFVSYPAIDQASEMTLLIRTSRAYEANLTAMNIAHQMYGKALELGGRS